MIFKPTFQIWDSYGNVTERDVNLNEVNVSNCDTFDFYAYSCYLSNSGKYPSAMQDFMMTHVGTLLNPYPFLILTICLFFQFTL